MVCFSEIRTSHKLSLSSITIVTAPAVSWITSLLLNELPIHTHRSCGCLLPRDGGKETESGSLCACSKDSLTAIVWLMVRVVWGGS